MSAEETPVATEPKTAPSLTLPAEVQEELKKAHSEVQELTLRLGNLEVDYLNAKNNLLSELDKRAKARSEVLTKAAKDAGLDTENNRWVLDLKTMTLVKQA